MDQHLILNAISYAARRHRHQLRKDGKTPYIAHPMRVLTLMSLTFGVQDTDVLAAAILHDTIEDTTADRDSLIHAFNARVAEYVALLSKDKRLPESHRESDYLDALAAAPIEVKLCKLADLYDNLLDSREFDAAEQAKNMQRAKKVVDRFTPGFPAQWQHALEAVRRLIED